MAAEVGQVAYDGGGADINGDAVAAFVRLPSDGRVFGKSLENLMPRRGDDVDYLNRAASAYGRAAGEADAVLNFLWRKEFFFCFRERLKQSRSYFPDSALAANTGSPAVTVDPDSCVCCRISQQSALSHLIRNVVRYEGYGAFVAVH